MKYFLDQEFLEGFHKPLFGRSRHFIDLISIGIVAEDGREYYAVCREFDLDKAWADEWIRNNVLKPLHAGMVEKEGVYAKTYHYSLFTPFTKRSLGNLLRWQGKTRKRISADVEHFCHGVYTENGLYKDNDVQFYGYYADYDWVLFCSLFGRMIDLPKGFPMYCRDLKQMFDGQYPGEYGKRIKLHAHYPEQQDEHHALADARWNKKLFEFIDGEEV
jgi:hypothetical protein